jgi:uncharacterized protein (TIGR02679 family)
VVSVPPSLRSEELDPLWVRVRERLEVYGVDNRGRLRLPELSSQARLALEALVGRPPRAQLDLGRLETALLRLGVGHDLASALAALGHPVSDEQAARRAERAERRRVRSAARAEAEAWSEPWAREWIDEVIGSGLLRGLDHEQVGTLLHQARRVLDRLLEPDPGARARLSRISRVDLAAQVLGSAHALDRGTRLEATLTRALRFHLGPASGRELWEQAGVHLDLTSAPVLTWGLPLTRDSGLAPLAAEARRARVPLHLSRFALEHHPAAIAQGTRLLVVENPRIVEAAAQALSSTPVISTHGQPASSVLLLLAQLAEAGAELRYHGDFDTAGLAICERLTQLGLGLRPWRMNAFDYLAALEAADADGADLPVDLRAPGPTSWDPSLQSVFDRERRIVHQERLLPELLETPID